MLKFTLQVIAIVLSISLANVAHDELTRWEASRATQAVRATQDGGMPCQSK